MRVGSVVDMGLDTAGGDGYPMERGSDLGSN